jgi:YVTN family beta-propeller protein
MGIAYDSVNGQIFVANYNSNSVSVIADSNNTVIANVTLEKQPQAIGYDSGKGQIFVTYSESNRVSVISDSSLPLPSPPIPEYPSFIVVSFLMATIFLTAILYRGKHQIETRMRKQ